MVCGFRTLGVLGLVAAMGPPFPGHATDFDRLTKAKELFDRYVALEHAYDPAVADLYDDSAHIQTTRLYASGEEKTVTIPAPEYKALIRRVLPLAQSRNDRNTYSNVTYVLTDGMVRIKALRYSENKENWNPLLLLVGPGAEGDWQIFEEISESRL